MAWKNRLGLLSSSRRSCSVGSFVLPKASLNEQSGKATLSVLICRFSSLSDRLSGRPVCQTGQAYSSSDLIVET